MDILNVLPYAGITVLVILLVIFEVKYKRGNNFTSNDSYTYYTYNNVVVRIRHMFGSRYRIYVDDTCLFSAKHDGFGNYFTLHAHSAADAEYKIDELYKNYQGV